MWKTYNIKLNLDKESDKELDDKIQKWRRRNAFSTFPVLIKPLLLEYLNEYLGEKKNGL